MNTWSFPHGAQSTNKTDPFTFTNVHINQNKIENNLQEEVGQVPTKEEISHKNNFDKDLQYEGQRTNELKNFTYEPPKEVNNVKNNFVKIESNNEVRGEEGEEGEEDKLENYYYNGDLNQDYEIEEKSYDDYYYISEYIPPQNFSQKLKNIKLKYEKLKKEIELLKKENKKYNPNFMTRFCNNKNTNQPKI